MDSHPLGIGIIGAGQIIKRHALAYRSLPDLARLVAVAEIDPTRGGGSKEGCPTGGATWERRRRAVHVVGRAC